MLKIAYKRSVELGMLLVGIFLGTACAPGVNLAQLKQVKKLAIVGYTATIERPAEQNTNISFLKSRDRTQDNAIFAYEQLGKALEQHIGWDVVPYSELVSNLGYRTIYDAVQSQNVVVRFQTNLGSLSSDFYPKDVMWALNANSLSKEQRTELCDALGVDAIGTALIKVKPKSTSSFLGNTSTTYAAQVAFRVWKPGNEEEIWKDLAAMGEESEGASGWNFGGITFQNEDQRAFLQAVGLGYVELLRRFDAARKKAKAELEGK